MPLFLRERLKRTSYIKCFCQRSFSFFVFEIEKMKRRWRTKNFHGSQVEWRGRGIPFLKKKTDRKSEDSSVSGRFSPGSGWICPRVGSSGRTGWQQTGRQQTGQKAGWTPLSAPAPPRLENKHRWTTVRTRVELYYSLCCSWQGLTTHHMLAYTQTIIFAWQVMSLGKLWRCNMDVFVWPSFVIKND